MDVQNLQVPKSKLTLKKIGVIGFLFFLVKGLAWLVVFAWMAWKAST